MPETLARLTDASQPTRYRVLTALKLLGEASAHQLAERLQMTPMGVRRHLYALEEEGLVRHRVVRQGPGRPRFLYTLTASGHGWFGNRYATLTLDLLHLVRETYGDEAVQALFQRRGEERLARARERLAHLPLPERVAGLAALLDQEGYLADWRQEDGCFYLCEHHCAIQAVAAEYPQACQSEWRFIQQLFPEAVVERVRHVIGGDTACVYRIQPRTTEHEEGA